MIPARAALQDGKMPDAVPSNKLRKFAKSTSSKATEEPEDMRYEAYASLLDTAVRRAWVCLLNPREIWPRS